MFNRTGTYVMANQTDIQTKISTQAIIWLLLSLSITFTLYAFNMENWVPACFVVFAIWRYLIKKTIGLTQNSGCVFR